MKAALLLLCAGALLTGCATHSDEQIAAVRAAGVSPRVVAKLQRDRVLSPEDLIELRRKNVSDSVAIRHLDDVGVDYIIQRNDLRKLRAAGVRSPVIRELVSASGDFVEDQYRPSGHWTVGVGTYDPWYHHYDAPFGYGWPYYY